MIDFPEKFLAEMKELLGDEYETFLKSYDKPLLGGIRANTLKISPEELNVLLGGGLKPVPWNPSGFYAQTDKSYARSPYYYAGLYYIQEPSAMLPAALLPVEPGDKVLDMCAAPGGKSTALGAALKGTGLLISNDVSASRAKALLKNIELFGIRNAAVTSEYASKLETRFPEFFDKILIDAPCSGEGMFKKKSGMTANWEEYGPESYNVIQREIILNGARMLKKGGMMVYSTCTFSRLEDEETIEYLLNNYPEFRVIGMRRIWPHKEDGEGHFACLLQKGEADGSIKAGSEKHDHTALKNKNKAKLLAPFYDFLKETGVSIGFDEARLVLNNDHLNYLPEGCPELNGIRVLRCGWYLGNIKNGRFEPSGAFAMGLRPDEIANKISVPSSDPRTRKYLKCETIETDAGVKDGKYLIMADDYPLGWGIVRNGNVKNKYPAGWRMQG